MGMSVKEFAVRTSKPEKTIFAVIGGKSSVTSDMAVAFESVTKIPAHFWLNIQRGYDEYVARQKREEQLALAYEWACSFPLAKMMELGWIPMVKTVEEKVKALLSFFQVSTERAWEDYYLNQQLKVAFRISLNNTKEPHAISAWLRQGEVQAAETEVCEFSEKALREAIPAMKASVLSILLILPWHCRNCVPRWASSWFIHLVCPRLPSTAPQDGSMMRPAFR